MLLSLMRSRVLRFARVGALGLAAVLVATACSSPLVGVGTGSTVAAAAAPIAAAADSQPAGDLAGAIRQVAASLRPAVVQITTEQVAVGQFNQPFAVPAGVGSGVIYDSEGHILTNAHVVAGAGRLLVSLPDGRSFPGHLVGADPQTDLAVVQISGDNLPVAPLGDSSRLQVGDWVVAIGDALALPGGPTVSQGVVSALGRTVQEPGESGPRQSQAAGPFLFDVIQTDAPINPGNSGGPLANLNGEVVGINTLVAGQAEPGVQAQGIGFAISVATAKPIADQLVASGRVVHPYLGVSYLPLNPAIAAQLGLQATSGVVIGQVAPGSPAAAAGLQSRDVITAVDGQALPSDSALAQAISAHQPGDTLTLTVIRGGQQMSVSAALAAQPSGATR
jgi:serine protease Do